MKKIIAAALILALALAVCGCSAGDKQSGARLPRAFNVLQKETSVEIRARRGESVVFRAADKFGASSPEATLEIEVAANASGLKFADMDGDPAHLGAVKLCENEVMTYKSQNGEYVFEPDGEVARIDFVVMLTCAAGESGSVRASAQTEAADGGTLSSGLKGYLAFACENGFVKLENGGFRPYEAITAGEAAQMTALLLRLPESGSDPCALLKRAGITGSLPEADKKLDRRTCALLLYGAAEYADTFNS